MELWVIYEWMTGTQRRKQMQTFCCGMCVISQREHVRVRMNIFPPGDTCYINALGSIINQLSAQQQLWHRLCVAMMASEKSRWASGFLYAKYHPSESTLAFGLSTWFTFQTWEMKNSNNFDNVSSYKTQGPEYIAARKLCRFLTTAGLGIGYLRLAAARFISSFRRSGLHSIDIFCWWRVSYSHQKDYILVFIFQVPSSLAAGPWLDFYRIVTWRDFRNKALYTFAARQNS